MITCALLARPFSGAENGSAQLQVHQPLPDWIGSLATTRAATQRRTAAFPDVLRHFPTFCGTNATLGGGQLLRYPSLAL